MRTYCSGAPGERVKSGVDVLRDVEPEWVVEMLCTAAQCRTHGLNDIARALYARGLKATANPVPAKWSYGFGAFGSFKERANGWKLYVEADEARSASLELRHAAFAYWQGRIMEPGIDRREVLRYLHAADLGVHSDISDLERTVAARRSKPGTAEAIIDDLIEWRTWDNIISGEPDLDKLHPGEAAYWRLAEMGFDAIPALLDHMEDSRFTRHPAGEHDFTGFKWKLSSPTRVGQLARYLVNRFAGEGVIGVFPDDRIDQARAWWEKAKRVGEEKWLVAHALPEAREDVFSLWRSPNRVIFRALGAKYPRRLAEIYRTLLGAQGWREGRRLEQESRVLCFEIMASKLPLADKPALLKEGATHKRIAHRLAALTVLEGVDPAEFRKQLVVRLRCLPPDVEGNNYWYCLEGDLVGLAEKANDPACWDALAAAAKRASVGLRFELIRRVGSEGWPQTDRPARRERLRFLLGFLRDASARGPTPPDELDAGRDSPTLQVRDFAASLLVQELGLRLASDSDRGPLSRLIIRAIVGQVAGREIAERE